ncbi:MAG TPA: cupredoxin domain-containing protein [Solirubrobacterales bacterium]|nr:cupredoxin domain-containing protein [Solirubrobacterales bacterium]
MKKVVSLLVLVLVSAALVACGDDDDGTTTTDTGGQATNGAATGGGANGGGASATVAFEADPAGGLAYTTDEASAKAGAVTIDFKNPQPVAHDVVIEDASGSEVGGTDVITESSTSADVKDLKPGEYTFYCSVPGHREAGMEGTLTAE